MWSTEYTFKLWDDVHLCYKTLSNPRLNEYLYLCNNKWQYIRYSVLDLTVFYRTNKHHPINWKCNTLQYINTIFTITWQEIVGWIISEIMAHNYLNFFAFHSILNIHCAFNVETIMYENGLIAQFYMFLTSNKSRHLKTNILERFQTFLKSQQLCYIQFRTRF
jgi:hypothetical protein